jgi:hypothetical protein
MSGAGSLSSRPSGDVLPFDGNRPRWSAGQPGDEGLLWTDAVP